MHKPWGVSSYHLERSLFDPIIISIFHLGSSCYQVVIWIFWLLALFVDASSLFFCNLWILNIVWFPPRIFVIEYVHMVSTHLYEKCTRCGENLTMLTFYFFSPILAIDANGGEVLEGLMELALCFFPLALLLGFVYSGNSTTGNGWQYMQWIHVHTHVHRLWGSLLYICGWTNI